LAVALYNLGFAHVYRYLLASLWKRRQTRENGQPPSRTFARTDICPHVKLLAWPMTCYRRRKCNVGQ